MTDASTPSSSPEPPDDDALEARRPCPDGNCVGVADAHGVCTECGCYIGAPDAPDDEHDLDNEDRSPCPDGSCIGVIGADGVCTECGVGGSDDETDDDDAEDAEDDDWDDEAGDDEEAEDDDDRIPCPDGACIGILEADGSCSECGRTIEEHEA